MNAYEVTLIILVILIVIVILWLITRPNKCPKASSPTSSPAPLPSGPQVSITKPKVGGIMKDSMRKKSKYDERPSAEIIDEMGMPKSRFKVKNKSETLPTFMRKEQRFFATASRVDASEFGQMPRGFDVRQEYGSLGMVGIQDQGACGSCWAFAACSTFSDRIKIASKNKLLGKDDHISQFHLAACMKCPGQTNSACKRVCDGHYMDEVMEYIKRSGAFSFGTIRKFQPALSNQYACFKPRHDQVARSYKAKSVYRVNAYTVGELGDRSKREYNEKRIMYDIWKYGPVTCTIRVFDPLKAGQLHQNFYLYEDGVYGYPWAKDPVEYDGYHALAIIGWGVENIKGKEIKYWILRNSWGPEWGMGGYGKIVRGENRAIVESDIWSMKY